MKWLTTHPRSSAQKPGTHVSISVQKTGSWQALAHLPPNCVCNLPSSLPLPRFKSPFSLWMMSWDPIWSTLLTLAFPQHIFSFSHWRCVNLVAWITNGFPLLHREEKRKKEKKTSIFLNRISRLLRALHTVFTPLCPSAREHSLSGFFSLTFHLITFVLALSCWERLCLRFSHLVLTQMPALEKRELTAMLCTCRAAHSSSRWPFWWHWSAF